jgi:choline kinase
MIGDIVNNPQTGDPVRTALLLAAGTGSRLQPLTHDAPKCLTEINGVPILEQQVRCLEHWGFEHLVVVVGHMENSVRDFLERRPSGLRIEYITNPRYRTTNNIYSLWLAREVVREPFLLLESDLFFDLPLLGPMLRADSIAVSTFRPWMTGSTVELDQRRRVVSMHVGAGAKRGKSSLKTVNIYSLSANTWRDVTERLDRRITAGHVCDYYEIVFSEMIAEGTISFRPVLFDHERWYEIDTMADLEEAKRIFLGPTYGLPSRSWQYGAAPRP